jgi:hypothetical protein
MIFGVSAGAPTASLWVNSLGNVGLGTDNPLLKLHLSNADTPGIRLEQTNAGGFTAQTWDVAGNEANFFIRDVTNGSLLPFRIRPGAPTSSIDIASNGFVGFGTSAPTAQLHTTGTYASKVCPAAAAVSRPMPKAIYPVWSVADRRLCNRLHRVNRLRSVPPPTAPRWR